MTTWITEDDFLEDLHTLSYGNCKKLKLKSKDIGYKDIIKRNRDKSIYDDDSDVENVARNNCIPVRGRNVSTSIKSPSGQLIFMEHVKQTKASIREAGLNNYSNEYIEQVLKSDNVANEKVDAPNIDFTFKPIVDEVQEEANVAKVKSRSQFVKPQHQHFNNGRKHNNFRNIRS